MSGLLLLQKSLAFPHSGSCKSAPVLLKITQREPAIGSIQKKFFSPLKLKGGEQSPPRSAFTCWQRGTVATRRRCSGARLRSDEGFWPSAGLGCSRGPLGSTPRQVGAWLLAAGGCILLSGAVSGRVTCADRNPGRATLRVLLRQPPCCFFGVLQDLLGGWRGQKRSQQTSHRGILGTRRSRMGAAGRAR